MTILLRPSGVAFHGHWGKTWTPRPKLEHPATGSTPLLDSDCKLASKNVNECFLALNGECEMLAAVRSANRVCQATSARLMGSYCKLNGNYLDSHSFDGVFSDPANYDDSEVPEEVSNSLARVSEANFTTLFLSEILRGTAVLLSYGFREPVTISYPWEKGPLSPRFRGEHALRRYPNGEASEKL